MFLKDFKLTSIRSNDIEGLEVWYNMKTISIAIPITRPYSIPKHREAKNVPTAGIRSFPSNKTKAN